MKKVRHWLRFETRFHSHQAVVGVVVSVHSLLILVDWREERCWKTIPTSNRLYCQSVGESNEESKALVAIRDEISFSSGYCRCCRVGPFTLILVDWCQERCWKTIPTSKGLYCRSVGGSNEESKALVAIRDEFSFSPGCCRCCCVGPLTLILFDCRQEQCWNTIPTSKGLYCRSVGGSNEESKALVAIRDEISFSPSCCRCCRVGPFTFDSG